MWLLSQDAGLTINLRSAEMVHAPNGDLITRRPKLKIHFRPGGFPNWAYEIAKERWPNPKGMPDTMVNPRAVYGGCSLDAQAVESGWSDEDLAWAKEKVANWPGYTGASYIIVTEPGVDAPWPTYLKTCGGPRGGFPGKTTAEAIAEMVEKTGSDPEQALAYERQEFSGGRPEVVEALERLLAPADEPELVTA